MKLTDTHIHLYADEFTGNLDQLLKEAFFKNVHRFFIPNIDSSTMDAMFAICKNYPENCFPSLGLHPCHVGENYMDELARIKSRAGLEKIYAVGETGIDLYWDKTLYKEQEAALIIQMRWAQDWNLPLIIHSREATDELIRIIEDNQALRPRGIFHCFSGNIQQARRIIELGFSLGIGGVLTFKNSGLEQVISQIDMKHLVLETDAPYLAPAPHRGKKNEPAFLHLIAMKLASVKHISIEDVTRITSENATRVFGI